MKNSQLIPEEPISFVLWKNSEELGLTVVGMLPRFQNSGLALYCLNIIQSILVLVFSALAYIEVAIIAKSIKTPQLSLIEAPSITDSNTTTQTQT